MRIGLGSGLTNARGAAAAPPPNTVTFNSTALYPAYAYGGRYDPSDVTKLKFMSLGASWRFRVTGTDATLKVGGNTAAPFWVSVDGAAETNPTVSGGKITLLSGAAQAAHTINLRIDDGAAGGNGWATVAADALSVTGVLPAHSADPNYGAFRLVFGGAAGGEARFAGTDFDGYTGGVSPEIGSASSGVASGKCGGGGYRFTATVDDGKPIWALTKSARQLLLETDGVAGPQLDVSLLGGTYGWFQVGTGDGAQHEYRVTISATGRLDAVMIGGSGSTFSTASLSARKYIFAVGDSTTAGTSCSGQSTMNGSHAYQSARLNSADVEVGAKSGDTTAQQNADAAALIANLPHVPDAVVILCGYNDADAATTQTQYTNLLNTVLAATTCKIVAIQLYGGSYVATNAAVAAAVAACTAPARVILDSSVANFPVVTEPTVPTSGQIQTCDGLHPTILGAQRIATNDQTSVAAALA